MSKLGIEKWARTTRISGAIVKFDPRPTSAVDETRDYEKNLRKTDKAMRKSLWMQRQADKRLKIKAA